MKKTVLITIVLLQLLACQKEPSLPLETQSGENTFGMLLDGELWLPNRVPYSAFRDVSAAYFPSCDVLGISARNFEERLFFSTKIEGEGVYLLSSTFPVIDCYGDSTKNEGDLQGLLKTQFSETNTYYFLLDSLKSNLTITKFDTLRKIVAGRFEMKLYDSNHSELNITEGVFDVNYVIYKN